MLSKSFFDLGGEFKGKRVQTLGEVTNILEEVVVGDEGRDSGEESGGGGGEPGHAFFDAADFVGGGKLHADGDGWKRFDLGMRIITFPGDLRLEFAVSGGVDIGERRAGGNDPLGIGNAFGGSKYLEELVGLAADTSEDAQLLENKRPGDQREEEQDAENGARNQAGFLENFKDVADEYGG